MHKVNTGSPDAESLILLGLCECVSAHTPPAPFRWKQYEAYVQVLETKYADLCCKYNTNMLQIRFSFSFGMQKHSEWIVMRFPLFPSSPFQPMM